MARGERRRLTKTLVDPRMRGDGFAATELYVGRTPKMSAAQHRALIRRLERRGYKL